MSKQMGQDCGDMALPHFSFDVFANALDQAQQEDKNFPHKLKCKDICQQKSLNNYLVLLDK